MFLPWPAGGALTTGAQDTVDSAPIISRRPGLSIAKARRVRLFPCRGHTAVFECGLNLLRLANAKTPLAGGLAVPTPVGLRQYNPFNRQPS